MSRTKRMFSLLLLFALLLGACQPTVAPVAMTPADSKLEVICPPTGWPDSEYALPVIELPKVEEEKVAEIAANNRLSFNELARENTVLYALPDRGIASLFTPIRTLPVSSEDLKENPESLSNQVLGALTVVYTITEGFREGTTYAIVFQPGQVPEENQPGQVPEENLVVFFDSEQRSIGFPAVIRELPTPIREGQGVASISSEQMCLGWSPFQVCAIVSSPLPPEWRDKLAEAITETGADVNQFELDRAIPDIEGYDVLAACKDALEDDPPNYGDCRASVLSAPVKEANSLPPLTDGKYLSGEVSDTGVLLVFNHIEEDVFSDVCLENPIGTLHADTYLMYDIVLPSDLVVNEVGEQQITISRAALITQVNEGAGLYVPALVGESIIGAPTEGDERVPGSEDIISNLRRHRGDCHWSCYFKRQCQD